MKYISTKIVRGGKVRVTLEIDEDQWLMAIRQNDHYRLPPPHAEVVPGAYLIDAAKVTWCPVEQEWRE
jgi:hypothetical protein